MRVCREGEGWGCVGWGGGGWGWKAWVGEDEERVGRGGWERCDRYQGGGEWGRKMYIRDDRK